MGDRQIGNKQATATTSIEKARLKALFPSQGGDLPNHARGGTRNLPTEGLEHPTGRSKLLEDAIFVRNILPISSDKDPFRPNPDTYSQDVPAYGIPISVSKPRIGLSLSYGISRMDISKYVKPE